MLGSPATCSNGSALSSEARGVMTRERLPISTVLPRAWIGFRNAPWRLISLAALSLSTAAGLGTLAHELENTGASWSLHASHLAWALSLFVPLVPLVGLLQQADTLLPGSGQNLQGVASKRHQLTWLLRQSLTLIVIEGLILMGSVSLIRTITNALIIHSGVLAAGFCGAALLGLGAWTLGQCLALPLLIHHHYRPLEAMEHSRRLVQHNRLKALALLGLLVGINILGLMGACLGLLLTLPFSALVLMAGCRTQTPWSND